MAMIFDDQEERVIQFSCGAASWAALELENLASALAREIFEL
jgi:hypothetical protein